MLCFPNAKINIGLRILGKRDDGYHNIETVMYPLTGVLYDALEIVRSKKFQFIISGNTRTKDDTILRSDDNLCVKAYQLLKKDFSLPPVKILLLKNIPINAGLGGGSANAAFTLKMLNEEFQLKLSAKKLMQYAAQLGSDCPFFILNRPALVTGKGEKVREICLPDLPTPVLPGGLGIGQIGEMKGKRIVVVYTGIQNSTAEAYRQWSVISDTLKRSSVSGDSSSLLSLLNRPVRQWKKHIVNDFEKVIFPKYPALKKIKEKFYKMGALYASMSGSGSAVYGIFAEY